MLPMSPNTRYLCLRSIHPETGRGEQVPLAASACDELSRARGLSMSTLHGFAVQVFHPEVVGLVVGLSSCENREQVGVCAKRIGKNVGVEII